MAVWDSLVAVFSWDWVSDALGTIVYILVIIAVAGIILRTSGPALRRIMEPRSTGLDERRAKTLTDLLLSVIRYLVYFFAFVAILDQVGVDTRSLIAGAGIAGLAIGFGAQNLVKDVVTGFFILLEDQYGVGDYVTVAGVSGVVESVGIRTTRVRDFGGQLHIIPNGKIDSVTNYMGTAMRVMFPVRVPYEEDVDRVVDILEELFKELAGELEDILEGPSVLGVNDLGESGVELLIWARAKPMTQWAMTRELRRRVKKRLDERGIPIAYGRRYLMFHRDPDGFPFAAPVPPDRAEGQGTSPVGEGAGAAEGGSPSTMGGPGASAGSSAPLPPS